VEGVKVIDVLTAFVEPRFTPDPIVLEVGEPVQFRVISADTRHTFTVDELNVDLQIAQKLLGGTAISEVVTPQTAGTFRLYCRIHMSVSYGLMSGVIQVVD
jgi:heme/copper-type cytochrome/quinol oxidase subunit 2